MRVRLNDVRQVAYECWLLFRVLYPQLPKAPPKIRFSRRLDPEIVFAEAYPNEIVFSVGGIKSHYDLFMSDIAKHEICHVVQIALFPKELEEHGNKWRMLMRQIGLEPNELY